MTDQASAYDDSNRAFLQAFLARSVLTLETAKPILAAIFSVQQQRDITADDVSQQDLNTYISSANRALSPLDFEIRSVLHQQTRERHFVLVNTTSDTFTQLATTHSAEEISYVKRLLDAMFDGPHNRGRKEAMCLSSMEAVQLGKANNRRETQAGESQAKMQGLSLRDAENVLDQLQAEGWLDRSAKGFYSLSPRALMELKGWLVDTYNEPPDEEDDNRAADKIKFCQACKEIITMGQRCPNYECACRLHDICTQNFFRMQRSHNCPLCNVEWGGDHYVGEKAMTASESHTRGQRRSTNGVHDSDVEMQEEDERDDDT